MKQTVRLFGVAIVAGAVTLAGYKLFVEQPSPVQIVEQNSIPKTIPTAFNDSPVLSATVDFREAAEKTVNAVVHVKNTSVRQPRSMQEYFFGRSGPRIGTGSGVIISPDGYIITNNHVIDQAEKLEVTLNNNRTYPAQLIGTDPKSDIALIKIDPQDDLSYVPFADSNAVQVGEWVLAVGNPFNLTSTVTAGIVSAKARDLNEFDSNPQSFIQTDAAVNRGNSGGALVNTRGELVGINTAITSETGSYVGYSFAVPSNTARKIVEDIMEYGNVQRGILGIQGGSLNTARAQRYGVDETEGVYVAGVESGSGADISGIQRGDIIKDIDGQKIGKFSDLTGYLGSKRPNDVVRVTVLRDGQKQTIPVTLVKLDTYELEGVGLEVKDANQTELERYGLSGGVKVNRILSSDLQGYDLDGIIITKINDRPVRSVEDAKSIMNRRDNDDPIKLTFVDRSGDYNSFIFR